MYSWEKEYGVEQTRRWWKKLSQDPVRYEKHKQKRRQNYLFVRGKWQRVNKRLRPNDICELCDREVNRLSYHHWDDDHPERGVWVCHTCHRVVGLYEKGLIDKYLRLKESISRLLR